MRGRFLLTQHFNRRSERAKRTALRTNATEAEQRLWQHPRSKQLGVKFRRQYSVDAYVVDFYAPRSKLAVEVGGDSHFRPSATVYDQERTRHLNRFGIEVVRFTNAESAENIEAVLAAIVEALKCWPTTSPWPPPLTRQIALRDLEQLSVANIVAWWMCGGRRIDHSTIGKFVQLHEDVLGQQFVTALAAWVVQRLKLRPGLSSIDGTVVESAASRWKLLQAEAAELAAAEASKAAGAEPDNPAVQQSAQAAQEVARVALQRCAKRAQQGKKTDTVVVACSDPDAVVQPRKDKVMRPAYKASTLMHEAGVIIGQYVVPSSETAAVTPLLEQHQAVFAQLPPTLLTDAGYHHEELLGELAEQGIDVLCPSGKAMGDDDWEKKGSKGLFAKNQFRYDDQRDAYVCPANELLSYADQGQDGRGHRYRRYRTAACAHCPVRAQCTTGKQGRSIKRYAGDEYKEAMVLVLLQPRAREVYGQRMPIAETVHAELRERFGLRRFHRRGLSAVRAEFGLYCIAFNLKKALRDTAVFLVFVVSGRQGGRGWAAAATYVVSMHIVSLSQTP